MTNCEALDFVVLCAAGFSACASQSQSGVLVMAHGGDDAWHQNVEASIAPIAAKWPVEIAYGMAVSSAIKDGVKRLEAFEE